MLSSALVAALVMVATPAWAATVTLAPAEDGPVPLPPTMLTLTWQDNATNEEGVQIWRGDDGGALRELTRVGVNVVTYRDETVARGHAYCYEVRAFNAAGASASSNRACKGPPGLPALTVSTEVTP